MNIYKLILDAKKISTELELLTAFGVIENNEDLFKKSTELLKITINILNEADRIGNGYLE